MATTYTSRVKAAKPATGENAGTWGTLVDTSTFDIFDQAIAGVTLLSMPDANFTMSGTAGVVDQGRAPVIYVTGALTAARKLLVPDLYTATSHLVTIVNRTTGGAIGYTLSVNSVTGDGLYTPILVAPQGATSIFFDANRPRVLGNAFGRTVAAVKFDGAAGTIANSLNVDSVSKSATGTYLITLTNAIASDYVISGTAKGVAGNLILAQEYVYSQTTTTFKVVTLNTSGTPTDCSYASVLVTA